MILQLAKKSNPCIKTIVFVITPVDEIGDKFKENNIEFHHLGINSFNFLKNSSLKNGLNKMHNKLKDIKNPVFHCHQFHGSFLAVLYKWFYNRKMRFAFTMHTNAVDSKFRRVFLFLTKPWRNADIIFSENSIKWYLKNTKVIPNGVDFSNFTANTNRKFGKNDMFSFLYLGRLSSEKNPTLLITAAQHLIDLRLNNFVIEYVGDGGMREELEENIKSNNLEKHFKFHGFKSDIKKYIQDSNCLVLPSFREGMPVVIIEAAAALLPVISTPVGSIPDFMNKHNGYLSNHEDFSKTMAYVMKNYKEALEKTKVLNQDVKTIFDIDKVYEQHLALYKSISPKN